MADEEWHFTAVKCHLISKKWHFSSVKCHSTDEASSFTVEMYKENKKKVDTWDRKKEIRRCIR